MFDGNVIVGVEEIVDTNQRFVRTESGKVKRHCETTVRRYVYVGIDLCTPEKEFGESEHWVEAA